MEKNIGNVNFHDCSLKYIHIDRENPGYNDKVSILVKMLDEKKYILQFKDTYQIDITEMGMGFLGDEVIYGTLLSYDDEELLSIKSRWGKAGVELDDLKCFEIALGPSSGRIRIFSRIIEMLPFEE